MSLTKPTAQVKICGWGWSRACLLIAVGVFYQVNIAMLMKCTYYNSFQSPPFLVRRSPQTQSLAKRHPKGDKNYNGGYQCSDCCGDEATRTVCETEQVKERAMTNERGEGCDNWRGIYVRTSDESVQEGLTHGSDKKHVSILKITEVLSDVIHDLSNASWSDRDDESK